jgi:hypothetical protein
MKLEIVPAQYTAQMWPLVEGFFARAVNLGTATDYSLEHIKMYVNQGQWALFVFGESSEDLAGALTVSMIKYPNDHVAFITCMGGTSICTPEMVQELKRLLKSMGATKVQAGGRDAIVRLVRKLGFEKRYTVVEATI